MVPWSQERGYENHLPYSHTEADCKKASRTHGGGCRCEKLAMMGVELKLRQTAFSRAPFFEISRARGG